jgi:hypothetical protein
MSDNNDQWLFPGGLTLSKSRLPADVVVTGSVKATVLGIVQLDDPITGYSRQFEYYIQRAEKKSTRQLLHKWCRQEYVYIWALRVNQLYEGAK